MMHQKLLPKSNRWIINFCQCFTMAVDSEFNSLTKQTRKTSKRKNNVATKQVNQFLEKTNQEHYLNLIPKKLFGKCVKNSQLYLVDPSAAKELSLLMSRELLQNYCSVVECNPGLGLLTQQLLNIGVRNITLLEKCEDFNKPNSPLHALVLKHNTRLSLKYITFDSICLALIRNRYRFLDTSDKFTILNSREKKVAYIIPIINRLSIYLLIFNFCNQTNLFCGKSSFYLVIPSVIWTELNDDFDDPSKRYSRQYTRYNVILKLFFNVTYLGNLQRKAFLPWPKNVQNNEYINDSASTMEVIKIEPKLQFPILSTDLKQFWYFLQFSMRSKRRRVIVDLEKIVPGCGLRLIQQNINICTRFKELSPTQLLTLFKEFKTWPEYKDLFAAQFFEKQMEDEEISIEDGSDYELEENEYHDTRNER